MKGAPLLAIPEPGVESLSYLVDGKVLKFYIMVSAADGMEEYIKDLYKRFCRKYPQKAPKIEDFIHEMVSLLQNGGLVV